MTEDDDVEALKGNLTLVALAGEDLHELARESGIRVVLAGAALDAAGRELSRLIGWYLMDRMRQEAEESPRQWAEKACGLARKIDAVLAEIDVTSPTRAGGLAMALDARTTPAARAGAVGTMTREALHWLGGYLDLAGAQAGDLVSVRVDERDARAMATIAAADAALKALRELMAQAIDAAKAQAADRRDNAIARLMAGLREAYEGLHEKPYTVSNAALGGTRRDTTPVGTAMEWTRRALALVAERTNAEPLLELAQWADRKPDGLAARIRATRTD